MKMNALKRVTLEAVKAALADAMAELYELRSAVDQRINSTSGFSEADERIADRCDDPDPAEGAENSQAQARNGWNRRMGS